MISYSAEGTISNSNSKEYPYFFRTIAENKQYKFAYIQTMKRLGWSKVAALNQLSIQFQFLILKSQGGRVDPGWAEVQRLQSKTRLLFI